MSVTSLTPACGPELLLTKYQRLSQLVRYTAFLEDATSALVRGPKKEGVQKRRLGRNPRIPFSSHQIALLEHKFRHKQYLSSYDVTELASLLCLSQTRVKIWFQNRRARERRDHEARTRTALPVVSGAPAVPPSTPSPTVLHSVRSAFQPVLGAAETVTECHRSQERPRLELDTAQTRCD